MNIKFLDAYSLNPGDLSWENLEKLGQFTPYNIGPGDDIVTHSADADVLIVNKVLLTADILKQLPRLRLICMAATGYDNVDVNAAKELGIPVCNAPGYASQAVAQATIALLLEATNHVGSYVQNVRQGEWAKSRDLCMTQRPIIELSGKRATVIGYGNIGAAVVSMLRPFGVKLCVVSNRGPEALPDDVEKVTIEEAFAESDIVSLNCPLSPDNEHFVDSRLLAHTKRGLILVNTARGGLIDEEAVAAALKNGILGAYMADVLSVEPPAADHLLIHTPHAFFTPHIAWASARARMRLLEMIGENIQAWIQGNATHVVNP